MLKCEEEHAIASRLDGGDDDAVWLVTGASYGIGRFLADDALRGARRVAVTANRFDALGSFVEEHGERAFPIELDVNDESADREAVECVVERYGRIDVVVNNAGLDVDESLGDIESTLERVQTNLFGALWVSETAVRFMREAGRGQIVLVFDPNAIDVRRNPAVAYRAKSALERFGEHLAQEVSSAGVQVTICSRPSAIDVFAHRRDPSAEQATAGLGEISARRIRRLGAGEAPHRSARGRPHSQR